MALDPRRRTMAFIALALVIVLSGHIQTVWARAHEAHHTLAGRPMLQPGCMLPAAERI